MSTFKRFLAYYRPYKGTFVIDLASAFVVAALELVFPTITKDFINDYIPNKQLSQIVTWSAILVAMYLVRAGFSYVQLYWGHMVGTRMEVDMRRDLFEHLHVLPFKYYDDVKTGQIMSRLVGDLREVSELAHHGPEDLFISGVMIAGSFAALVLINLVLTLIIFGVLLVLILYTLKKRIKMLETFRVVREAHGGINEQVENSISGIRVCFAFTNESHEIEQFNVHNDRYQRSYKAAYRHMAEYSAVTGFLMGFLLLVGLVVGGMYIYQGTMNYGDLVAFLLYTSFFVKPIERLVQFTQQYQTGIAGFERFIEIMDVKPAIVDKPGAVPLANPKGRIMFKGVSFCYGEGNRCIIKDLDLDVEPGSHVALVGTSGVGKTTIVHLIPRFYEVTGGAILIDGADVRDVTLRSLRGNIGIVQQDTFIFAGTIKENIRYGKLDATDEQVVAAAKQAQIHDFITSLPGGYETFTGERGVKLSGGQKQRIAIARVFLKNPPIVILDEATSSLDSATEAAIQESLDLLARDRTTITVAHRLSTIRHSDEILFIVDDGIAERGTHRALLAKGGLYARLYKVQHEDLPSAAGSPNGTP
jgi:ATP-binding cassette subfamily B protein